jgi:hypothetical protein
VCTHQIQEALAASANAAADRKCKWPPPPTSQAECGDRGSAVGGGLSRSGGGEGGGAGGRGAAHLRVSPSQLGSCSGGGGGHALGGAAAGHQEKKIVEQPQMRKVDLAGSRRVTCAKDSSNASSSKEAVKSTVSQVTCTKDSSNACLVRAGRSGDVGVRGEDVASSSLVVSIYV